MKPNPYVGKCDRCTNMAVLYPRTSRRLCVHCVDLDFAETGRVNKRSGLRDPRDPRSQPKTSHELKGPSRRPCVFCGTECGWAYWFAPENRTIAACGWGHAGLWMDSVLDAVREELELDVDYVYQSLGVTDGR